MGAAVTRLSQYQALAQKALKQNADLVYRHDTIWSDGTGCRFSVQDPNKVDTALNRSLRTRPDAADVRVLRVHPDSPCPELAAFIPWEAGMLFVERYAQTSDFTGKPTGICRFVDPARSRTSVLVFPGRGGALVPDGRGNLRPGPSVPITALARLEAPSDPQVRDAVGADAATTVLMGRWGAAGEPRAQPGGVSWGSQSPLVLSGQPGTLTVQLAWPDADPIQTAIHGEPFVALWRTL